MRTHIHPDLDQEQWATIVAALPQHMDVADDQILHKGRNKIVRTTLGEREVVIKYFRNHGIKKKLGYKLRSSKALRSFDNSFRLSEAGLLTPQPLAWREDWQGAWLHESYYVCAYHPVAHTAWDLKSEKISDHVRWIRKLGSDIGRMHEAGLDHQDLTPGNALYVATEKDDEFDLYFVDNNRMRFGSVGRNYGMRALVRMGLEGEHIDPYVEAYANERSFDVSWCQKFYRQLLRRHHFKWAIKNKTRPWRRKLGL